MAITLKVTGMKKVENIFRNLPKEMQKEIGKNSMAFMKGVKKSAKLRAPRDTGETSDSIKLSKKGNKIALSVGTRAARFQEEGFKPHWIHSDMIKGSNKLTKKGFFFVKKSKPFIQPALEKNIARLPSLLSQGTKRAISNSSK